MYSMEALNVPVFISYSHQDGEFAENLAAQLIRKNVHVWIDKWELRVGDSIIDKIEAAVDGASALLVILSEASVESEWCRKELSAGLLRELEERRVVVLPILIQDCKIPLFLRGKLYADFRTNFDDGLKSVAEGIAQSTNAYLARETTEPGFHTDWSIDWYSLDDVFFIRITCVELGDDQPFTVLTTLNIMLSPDAKRRYDNLKEQYSGDHARLDIVDALVRFMDEQEDFRMLLDDQFEKSKNGTFSNEEGDTYVVKMTSRRLGEDTGKDILVNRSEMVRQIQGHMHEVFAR